MIVKPFFHDDSKTFTYVVYDPKTLDALVIDPVLDFDLVKAKVSFFALNEIVGFLKEQKLVPKLVLDTHLHADHLSGAYYLKEHLKIKSAIGENFLKSQAYFADFYEMSPTAAYDLLLSEKEYEFGSIKVKPFFIPGHTASCTGFLVGDAFFCGDALFNPERGCGRADFPMGSALDLYRSIMKIYALPDTTKIFVGHDYPTLGQEAQGQTTVLLSKKTNVMIKEETKEQSFVDLRQKRDQTLDPPRLIAYALQVNICGGRLPEKFFKIPVASSKPLWVPSLS